MVANNWEKMNMEKDKLEEVKGTTFEEVDTKSLPADERKLQKIINKVQDKLHALRRNKKRSEPSTTPEGRRIDAQLKEWDKSMAASMKAQAEFIEKEDRAARRELALQLFGDELLRQKRYIIVADDPRLQEIVYERRRIRTAIRDII